MMDTWTHPFLTNWFQSCVLPCAWTFLENILRDITKTIWITCKKYLAATCDMSDCLIRGLETICSTLHSIVTDLTPCQYLRRKNILNQLFPAQTHRPRSSLSPQQSSVTKILFPNQNYFTLSALLSLIFVICRNIILIVKLYGMSRVNIFSTSLLILVWCVRRDCRHCSWWWSALLQCWVTSTARAKDSPPLHTDSNNFHQEEENIF